MLSLPSWINLNKYVFYFQHSIYFKINFIEAKTVELTVIINYYTHTHTHTLPSFSQKNISEQTQTPHTYPQPTHTHTQSSWTDGTLAVTNWSAGTRKPSRHTRFSHKLWRWNMHVTRSEWLAFSAAAKPWTHTHTHLDSFVFDTIALAESTRTHFIAQRECFHRLVENTSHFNVITSALALNRLARGYAMVWM